MLTRRSFLLDLGTLVTSAFVLRAKRHALDTGQPLLVHPAQVEQELYLYESFEADCGKHAYKYRASLGPDQWPAPEPPTWRDHLRARGYTLDAPADLKRLLEEFDLTPDELDQPLDGYWWESYWEHYESPQARAYQLIKDLQLDCDPRAQGRTAGTIAFTEWGGHPGSCERWVDVKDDLSVSILQARITEQELPIRTIMATL